VIERGQREKIVFAMDRRKGLREPTEPARNGMNVRVIVWLWVSVWKRLEKRGGYRCLEKQRRGSARLMLLPVSSRSWSEAEPELQRSCPALL
jgi:hypothetical protein